MFLIAEFIYLNFMKCHIAKYVTSFIVMNNMLLGLSYVRKFLVEIAILIV